MEPIGGWLGRVAARYCMSVDELARHCGLGLAFDSLGSKWLQVSAVAKETLKRLAVLARLAREFIRFPVLRERQHISGASLSGGEQQMLAVSRGLMMGPRAILLDEPSLGLAPQIVQMILRKLRQLADEGMTVLLVEQAAFLALEVADRGVVLRNGRAILAGPASQLRLDRSLVESYLS